jgi:hypothetical protein
MDFARSRRTALALVLATLLACADDLKTPPTELIDTWHSRSEPLRGRSLEIRDEWLLFGVGDFGVTMYPLLRIEQESRADGTHYSLYYSGEGEKERQLGVLYRPGQPATLRLDNRDELWVRTRDAAWLEEEGS